MIKDWFRRNVASVLDERATESEGGRPFGGLTRTLSDSTSPAAMIFKIDNGFILNVFQNGGLGSQVKYCKDAQDIAEALISQATKEKLGIHPQLAMPTNTAKVFMGQGSGIAGVSTDNYRSLIK